MGEEMPSDDAVLIQMRFTSTSAFDPQKFEVLPKRTRPHEDSCSSYAYLKANESMEVRDGTVAFSTVFIVTYLGQGVVSISPKKASRKGKFGKSWPKLMTIEHWR